MLCTRKGCIMAMDAVDEEHTGWVARSWAGEAEGALEEWRCPKCGVVEVTRMVRGRREQSSGLLVVQDVRIRR